MMECKNKFCTQRKLKPEEAGRGWGGEREKDITHARTPAFTPSHTHAHTHTGNKVLRHIAAGDIILEETLLPQVEVLLHFGYAVELVSVFDFVWCEHAHLIHTHTHAQTRMHSANTKIPVGSCADVHTHTNSTIPVSLSQAIHITSLKS